MDEWLKMLNRNMGEIIPMLDREEMKLEVIFREMIGEEEYLYWFSVQGDTGSSANADADYPVGQQHVAFAEECLDHDFGMRDAQPQVIMVPKVVAEAMGWENPPNSAVPFQRKEFIKLRGR